MSCLKLHWPPSFALYAPADAEWPSESDSDDAPVILSLPRLAHRSRMGRNSQRDLLTRARTIHENRCCADCGRPTVVPVDSEQTVHAGNHMPIPGTGALLGFECESCGHEWEA